MKVHPINNLSGQKFGNFTVVKPLFCTRSCDTVYTTYLLKCECGNFITRTQDRVDKVQICLACRPTLTDTTYKYWTIIGPAYCKLATKEIIYKIQCCCGAIRHKTKAAIYQTKSCGCHRNIRKQQKDWNRWRQYTDRRTVLRNQVYKNAN